MADFEEIAAFVAVVDAGGFRAAAGPMALTPSAVSKRVAALEARLGARLLNRTTRRVATTEIGQAFFERARAALDDLGEAESAVADLQSEARGTIRLNSPADFGRRFLSDPLGAFAAAHPEVALDVSFSERFVDVVGEGFDVVLRIGQLEDSGLVARRLATCRRVLVASPGYLERVGRPTTGDELAKLDFLTYAHDRVGTIRVDGASIALRGRHRADDGVMLGAMARAGLGVTLLPTFLCGDDLRSGALEEILTDRVSADLGLYAVTPHRQLLSAKIRRLLDHLRAEFSGVPVWETGLSQPKQGAESLRD